VTVPGTTDTTGTTGQSGPAPAGSAGSSGSTADTETPGAGGGSAAASPPATAVDTGGVNGGRLVNDPKALSPDVSGTIDTRTGGGSPRQDVSPAYRAPGAYGPGTILDTTRTDTPTSDGVVRVPSSNNMSGTLETGNIGAVAAPSNHSTPPAPATPTVVAAARGVQVTWVAPTPVSGAPTLGFMIRSDTGGTWYAAANETTKLLRDTLKPGQPYKFRVAARNYNGWGALSALSAAATPYNPDEPDVGKPAPGITADNRVNPIYRPDGTVVAGTGGWPTTPKSVAAAQASNTSATVTWAAPDYGTVTSYVVTASTGQTQTVSGSTFTATVTGLTQSTPVTFTVKAVTAKGSYTSAPSNSVTPGTPTVPQNVTAAVASATSATVTWTAPAIGLPLTGYTVTPSVGGSPQTVSGTTLTATMTGLTTGVAVTFTVTATNSVGSATSPASNSVTPA
jgi:hypothetical protein